MGRGCAGVSFGCPDGYRFSTAGTPVSAWAGGPNDGAGPSRWACAGASPDNLATAARLPAHAPWLLGRRPGRAGAGLLGCILRLADESRCAPFRCAVAACPAAVRRRPDRAGLADRPDYRSGRRRANRVMAGCQNARRSATSGPDAVVADQPEAYLRACALPHWPTSASRTQAVRSVRSGRPIALSSGRGHGQDFALTNLPWAFRSSRSRCRHLWHWASVTARADRLRIRRLNLRAARRPLHSESSGARMSGRRAPSSFRACLLLTSRRAGLAGPPYRRGPVFRGLSGFA